MNGDTLDNENFIKEEENLSLNNEEDDIEEKEEETELTTEKQGKKKENNFLNKKRSQISIKYPLRKIIDFSNANKLKICKVFNQISRETINIDNLFMKNMFLTTMNVEINQYINGLIEFKLDSLKESINESRFYKDKIKPYIVLYSSNCYDLIKYEKILRCSFNQSQYNMVILNFFGKHKKLKDEIMKINDKFNKSKSIPNTLYVILSTPNRILKLSEENLLDYTFLKYNVIDMTPNIKNLTIMDMKDCREDFFKFVKSFLINDDFNKSRYTIYLNK